MNSGYLYDIWITSITDNCVSIINNNIKTKLKEGISSYGICVGVDRTS